MNTLMDCGRFLSVGSGSVGIAAAHAPMVARYIYQDGEFGVVGIPVNNYQKKIDFRAQAEGLMARHFPEGYEIVRAEEVNEGERIRDVGRKTEIETEPAVAALNQIIRLGSLNRTTSFAEKDKLQVRECRIIYKKKPFTHRAAPASLPSTTSLAPPLYIDPNEILAAPDQDQRRNCSRRPIHPPRSRTTATSRATRCQESGGRTESALTTRICSFP